MASGSALAVLTHQIQPPSRTCTELHSLLPATNFTSFLGWGFCLVFLIWHLGPQQMLSGGLGYLPLTLTSPPSNTHACAACTSSHFVKHVYWASALGMFQTNCHMCPSLFSIASTPPPPLNTGQVGAATHPSEGLSVYVQGVPSWPRSPGAVGVPPTPQQGPALVISLTRAASRLLPTIS